jgi:transcriptional regulator with XRE-family HTH domain
VIPFLAPHGFRERLVGLREERGLTQQALADLAGLNVVQIRRWETGASQPSLDALMKLTRGLRTTTDDLLFGADDRGPDDEFRLQFEAITRLDPDEKSALRSVIEGMLIKHEARRWQTAKA